MRSPAVLPLTLRLLAVCGMGAFAAPQNPADKGPAPKPILNPAGAPSPAAGKLSGAKTGGAAGIPSGLFESLAQYQPLLNGLLGQPAKPRSRGILPSLPSYLKLDTDQHIHYAARGTLEPGPYGFIVGDPLLPMIKRKVSVARGYNVQYPADFSADSMAKGVADVVQRLNSQSKACPDAKFALVGYSQGAAVMHGVGAKLQADDQLMAKVLAIVLYGDGARSRAKWPAPLQSKVYENCAKGDMCGEGTQGNGHLSYRDGTFHRDGSDFIAAAYKGQPMAAHL